MDLLKLTNVPKMHLANRTGGGGMPALGSLHLTPHHLIFLSEGENELWIPLPLLYSVTRSPPDFTGTLHPILLRTRDFNVYELTFSAPEEADGVWESLKGLCSGVGAGGLPGLYAFFYGGQHDDKKGKGKAGWGIYEPEREFKRMGLGTRSKAWRSSAINSDYEFCPSYPPEIVVPAKISDTTLGYAVKYRSKGRIPGLVYLHWANLGSITRSSQPMVGLKNARSIQDEKLIECIFTSHSQHSTFPARNTFTLAPHGSSSSIDTIGGQVVYGAQATNLIIDARPTTNAVANSVKGAGTENMDHYKLCKKAYLGIDNIHVMRASLAGIYDTLAESEATGHLDRNLLRRTYWLKHLTNILDGILVITRTVHLSNSHVLVHCSDGWDRTSQLSSLAQLCLDPYYRTAEGFAVLVEKDWLSYGHRFSDRTGHLCGDKTEFIAAPAEGVSAQSAFLASVQKQFSGSSHAFKETCPVFQQFLDVVYQMQRQFPDRFEFNEPFLRTLQKETYAGKTGTFLFNSEKEREKLGARKKTTSVWDEVFEDRAGDAASKWVFRKEFRNALYDPELDDPESRALNADQGVLMANPQNVKWWFELFQRGDEEMNGRPEPDAPVEPLDDITIVDSASEDVTTLTAEAKNLSLSPSPSRNLAAPPPSSDQRSSSPGPPPSPGLSRATLPSQVQIAGAVSSVQKFGWGAWKAAQKGYQDVVTTYRDTSTASSEGSLNTSSLSASTVGDERLGGHSRVANGESSSSSWKAIEADGELKRSAPWGSSSALTFRSPSPSPAPPAILPPASSRPTSPAKSRSTLVAPGIQKTPSASSSPLPHAPPPPSTSPRTSTAPTPRATPVVASAAAVSAAGWTDARRDAPLHSNPWERANSPVKPPPVVVERTPVAPPKPLVWKEDLKTPALEDHEDPLGVGFA